MRGLQTLPNQYSSRRRSKNYSDFIRISKKGCEIDKQKEYSSCFQKYIILPAQGYRDM